MDLAGPVPAIWLTLSDLVRNNVANSITGGTGIDIGTRFSLYLYTSGLLQNLKLGNRQRRRVSTYKVYNLSRIT